MNKKMTADDTAVRPPSGVPGPESRAPTPSGSAAREFPERPIAAVGAVVTVAAADRARLGLSGVEPQVGVVLVKRRYPPLAGEWSLPGGAVELGETLDAAIAREVLEETGLLIDVGPVIEVFDRIMLHDSQRVQYHYVLIDYLCRAVGGQLAHGSDVADVLVADPQALDSFALTSKAQSVIAAALARLARPNS